MKSIAVQRWHGVEVVQITDGAAPAVTPSVPVTGQCPPVTARVVAHLVLPAFENLREPTCEELEAGFTRGGRIEGKQQATIGRRR